MSEIPTAVWYLVLPWAIGIVVEFIREVAYGHV